MPIIKINLLKKVEKENLKKISEILKTETTEILGIPSDKIVAIIGKIED